MDPSMVIVCGIAAGAALGAAVGIWRRGANFGLLCGAAVAVAMSAMTIPLWLVLMSCGLRRLT